MHVKIPETYMYLYTHAYNSYEFHFKSVDELLIEFLIEQKAIMKKIGDKSGLLIICQIKIHHIIGFSKSVGSVLFAAICTGSVWRPCLFVYVLVQTIFTT